MTRIADTPASSWIEVERAVAAFEQAYARGGTADPSSFCPLPGDPLRLPVAAELVRADLEFAARDGRGLRLDDFRPAFPDLFADRRALSGVAFEEYRLRRQAGESVTPGEYRDRFGIDPSSWPDDGRREPSLPAATPPTSRAGSDDLEAGRFPEPGSEAVGFRLSRVLGRGAFGRVYLAEQSDLAGRYVALKLSKEFVAEAGTLARLQHTNIVPVYSVHRAGRFQAICMPYLGSVTLADVLGRLRDGGAVPRTAEDLVSTVTESKGRSGQPPGPGSSWDRTSPGPAPSAFDGPLEGLRRRSHIDACLWIAAELAGGLEHAHERGVVHRDLKPANVLLSDEGRPMLLDFNLAGEVPGPAAGAEAVGGTPAHMAPEQLAALAGEPARVDARTDLYALGLILFELLTGRPAHPAKPGGLRDQIAGLRSARSGPPPSARASNPAVTPAVDAIVRRALEPDADARYPSARQLREDLLLHLEDRPLRHTREPSLRERARKAVRRSRWARSGPFVFGLVACVAAAGLAAYLIRTRQLDRSRAAVALTSFRERAEAARPRLLAPDPEDRDLESGLALGGEALALADAESPGGPRAFRHLTSPEREAARVELGELAYLMAGAEHRRADRAAPAGGASRLDRALRLNRMAGAFLAGEPVRRPYVAVQGAQLLASAGRDEEARALRSSVRPQADRAEGLWLAVADLDGRGEPRRALDLLRRHEPERGGSIEYWRARGRHHAAVEDWAEAASAFTTALAISTRRDPDLLARRGTAHLRLGDLAAARADYDAALAATPGDAALLRDRAQVRLGMGDHAGAVADLDRAEGLDPAHTRVLFMRSRVHARSGDRAASERDREVGMTRTPGDVPSWIARGMARLARDPEAAIRDFDQALGRDPASRQALQNKASALSEGLGRAEEAVGVLDRLIALHPEYVPARAGRGVLLARLGRRDAAHADARAALERSDAPFTRYQVAGIFALTSKSHPGDKAEALRLLASAFRDKAVGLSLVPNDPDLDPIRGDPGFVDIVGAASTLEAAATPPAR